MADADPRDLDQAWRRWASLLVLGGLLAGAGAGFLLLPVVQGIGSGVDAFTAICRSLGIAAGTPAVTAPVSQAEAQPVSRVAWSTGLIDRLGRAQGDGGRALAETCIACHGERGISADPAVPNLAGQSGLALYKQLSDYRSGVRVNEVMTPIAQALDDEQVVTASAWFAALAKGTLDPTTAQVLDPLIIRLVERGDPTRGIPACASCHGRRAGGPIETPSISGQNRNYLANQLQLYATGERRNDMYQRMRLIAAALTPTEIERLAEFYATTLSQ